MRQFKTPPLKTFVVHGEQATAQLFGELIHRQLGWSVEAPNTGASYEG